jgi:hypothetical protein
MHEDKKNKCYICGKDRGKVIYNNIYSYKKIIKIFKIIFIKNIFYGIIFIMIIV